MCHSVPTEVHPSVASGGVFLDANQMYAPPTGQPVGSTHTTRMHPCSAADYYVPLEVTLTYCQGI